MSRKNKLLVRLTLFIVLVFNYAIIGVPIIKKSASIQKRSRDILIRHVKSGDVLSGSDEDYVLELFRKEKSSIDRNLLVLNSITISLGILIASWTVFGLLVHRKK